MFFIHIVGDYCEVETDGCKLTPCSVGQKCTDLTASEQGNNSVGYKCGSCPAGTKDVNRSCEGTEIQCFFSSHLLSSILFLIYPNNELNNL